jgi:hypothetical protein
MTRRQIQRLQCWLRHGVNQLYYGYLASVLHDLRVHDRTGEIDRALATLPCNRVRNQPTAPAAPGDRTKVHRELKLRGDLGCARVREQLWRLQHLPFDLSAAGQRSHH